MGSNTRTFLLRAAVLAFAFCLSTSTAPAASIPATQATALDGHTVALPKDLTGVTVLILGFGRHSSDATTAWEKPTRSQLAHTSGVGFYDMAMLASVPHFMQGFVVGRIHKAVPDVLKPNFLPLFTGETEWKTVAGFDPDNENAAYVLLVGRDGNVHWSTHQPFTPALFAQLSEAAATLARTQPAK